MASPHPALTDYVSGDRWWQAIYTLQPTYYTLFNFAYSGGTLVNIGTYNTALPAASQSIGTGYLNPTFATKGGSLSSPVQYSYNGTIYQSEVDALAAGTSSSSGFALYVSGSDSIFTNLILSPGTYDYWWTTTYPGVGGGTVYNRGAITVEAGAEYKANIVSCIFSGYTPAADPPSGGGGNTGGGGGGTTAEYSLHLLDTSDGLLLDDGPYTLAEGTSLGYGFVNGKLCLIA